MSVIVSRYNGAAISASASAPGRRERSENKATYILKNRTLHIYIIKLYYT